MQLQVWPISLLSIFANLVDLESIEVVLDTHAFLTWAQLLEKYIKPISYCLQIIRLFSRQNKPNKTNSSNKTYELADIDILLS